MRHRPKSIVITGASSGIGAALARRYARIGSTLALLGRDQARLENTAEFCRAQGASAEIGVLDVCNASAMSAWLTDYAARHPVDLLIANAGISAGTGGQGESEEQVRRIFNVNVNGVFNTIFPLLPSMQARKSGQIAIISSLASMRGLPSCPAYSASKAAVRFFGEGLRGTLKKDGIRVNIVCPGYVRTPLTAVNNFPMPLIMSPEKAAEIIARGLAANRSRIAFPLALYLPLWLLSCFSPTLTDWFFAALPGKGVMEEL